MGCVRDSLTSVKERGRRKKTIKQKSINQNNNKKTPTTIPVTQRH